LPLLLGASGAILRKVERAGACSRPDTRRIGFEPKSYQENRRASFQFDGARLELDWWPLIPPYLEIEGDSREHVVEVAGVLGIDEGRLTGENTIKVYARYGIDLTTIHDLRFDEEGT
jgi:adenylate cyclase class 2